MTISYVEYDLQDGFINNWLTAGPQTTPIQVLPAHGAHFKTEIFRKFDTPKPGITKTPVERGPLTEGLFKIGNYTGSWSYFRSADDHRVDLSTTLPTCHHLRAWAYTQLISPAAQQVSLTLHSAGPVKVWINQIEVFSQDVFSKHPEKYAFTAGLMAGKNEIMLRFEAIADPVGLLIGALQVQPATGLRACIPTLIPSLERRAELERVYQTVFFDRDVYAAEDTITLCWPEIGEKSSYNDVQLKNSAGFIFGQAEDVGKANDRLFLGHPVSLTQGEYRAFIMPRSWEYYESQIRITQEIPAYVMGKYKFSEQSYSTQGERCVEALVHASGFENNLFAEIAKMGLNWWDEVEPKVILRTLEIVKQRQAGSVLTALGLIGMLARFGTNEKFPLWIKDQTRDTLINFCYNQDEPGGDMLDFNSESQQILFHTCEILVGQAYPNHKFVNSGLNGRQHRLKGEKLALEWMQNHGQMGFTDWDSSATYADILTALSYLIDLAKAEPVWGLASVLMDKLLFTLALNTFNGACGSTQGSAKAQSVKSGLLAHTAGITRLFWGMGVFNANISATVSHALIKNYEMPELISEIATNAPAEMWNQEQCGLAGKTVNKVTFRTPHGMLSSAQDYHPGEPGAREQIWQATLAPNCVVFSNHPACSSEKEELAPNFWRGNGILPRVAQWKDTLIALYQLPPDDILGYTHAYFPIACFDEVSQREGWIFGRKNDGFIALKSSLNMELVQQGRTALRELRAYGPQSAWLCQMGSPFQDGDFTAFQEKVIAGSLSVEGLSVKWQTIRGESLSMGWQEPFVRNGETQNLANFKHFENPYTTVDFPCEQMEIRTDDYVLRLDFRSEA